MASLLSETPPGADIAKAEAVLSGAVITRVSGSRPLKSRRWFNRAVFYAGSIAVGLALAAAANPVLEHSGLYDEFRAFKNPVASVESAPQQIKWVELPSSPFLEAGRRPDGGLSVHQMLQAWEAAGLKVSDVPEVLKKVYMLRPTLLGRADETLERQLQEEAAMAAAALERDFPEVVQRLASRAPSVGGGGWFFERPGSPNDRGSSATAGRWGAHVDTLAKALSDPIPEPDWSVEARVEALLAWNQSKEGGKRPLPLPPILSPGLTEDGFSVGRLVDSWRAAGLSPLTALDILSTVKAELPVLSGSLDGAVDRRLSEAAFAHQSLAERFANEVKKLESNHDAADFPPPPVADGWGQEDWDSLWADVKAEGFAGAALPALDAGVTFEQGRQALAQAVQTTGLRSLSPSLDAWHSPHTLIQTAQRLEKANAQLEQITGWKGKVLGLDGRVELSLGEPRMVRDVSGFAHADESGRLQMAATWSALGHEWFHAFEFVASRLVMKRSSELPLSENLQPLRGVAHPHVHSAMKALLDTTQNDMPVWRSYREEAVETRGPYWVRPAEVLAFAFDSYIDMFHEADALGVPSHNNRLRENEPERAPSRWEAQALTAPLKELFESAAALGLSGGSAPLVADSMKVHMASNVSQWRSGRALSLDETTNVTPSLDGRMPTLR